MSLRIKFLLALVLLLGVTLFALLSIGKAWEDSLRARQEADINVLLSKRVDMLTADISAARDTLRLLAQTSNLSDLPTPEIQQRLERLSIAQSRFESFYISTTEGEVTPPFGVRFSVSDRDYFSRVAAAREAVSDPLISRHTGQRVMVMFSGGGQRLHHDLNRATGAESPPWRRGPRNHPRKWLHRAVTCTFCQRRPP